MQECSEQELLSLSGSTRFPFAVYVHNPLCGTCKLAERMIRIALEVGPCIPIFKNSILYSPQLMEAWTIHSVPCLCIVHEGKVIHKLTALRSVDTIYEAIKTR